MSRVFSSTENARAGAARAGIALGAASREAATARGQRPRAFWHASTPALLVVIALMLLIAPAASAQRLISLAFKDTPAADAIAQLAWLAEAAIVLRPPASDARVSLVMDNVPAADAIRAVADAIQYGVREVGPVYVLAPTEPAPLLPAPAQVAEQYLYADRQGLDAARLALMLSPSQIAQLAQGGTLAYSDLSAGEQDLLGGIYRRLIRAAQAGWVSGATSLENAPAEPPLALAFGIRGWVWRMQRPPQQPTAPPAAQASTPPAGQPAVPAAPLAPGLAQ